MRNYFNYYTEIEEHFQRRRGTLLMLSTLDWSLIAAWQEAGFPVEAVLAGIDATFDKYETRRAKGRARRINGLAYCGQEVLRAAENMHVAATGASRKQPQTQEDTGLGASRIAAHLHAVAERIATACVPAEVRPTAMDAKASLEEIADSLTDQASDGNRDRSIEQLEQKLLVLEDKLLSGLQTFTPTKDLLAVRERMVSELAAHRSRLQTAQVRQIEQQFLKRCLFERYQLPRLSLFYMPQS